MPSSQSTNVMLSEGLVVVQQCLEGLALPLVNSLVVEIRVGLLVLIVNEVLLEVVVVLVVVYIRSTQLCYQAIDDLVVNTEETGKVGITTIYLQIVVEPCDRATIRNGSPCAVIITGGNPWCNQVELTNDLVGTTTCVCRRRVGIIVLDISEIQAGCEAAVDLHLQVGTAVDLLTASVRQDTRLLQITYGCKIVYALCCTVHAYVVVLQRTSLVSQVVPVGIRECIDFLFRGEFLSLALAFESVVQHVGILV